MKIEPGTLGVHLQISSRMYPGIITLSHAGSLISKTRGPLHIFYCFMAQNMKQLAANKKTMNVTSAGIISLLSGATWLSPPLAMIWLVRTIAEATSRSQHRYHFIQSEFTLATRLIAASPSICTSTTIRPVKKI
jgi:hypothetical protein